MPDGVLTRRSLWLLALVSLAFGVWRSLQPEALEDLHRVVEWSATLMNGVSPYLPGSDTDYPPWALVMLAPLSLLPAALRVPFWICANLALATAIVWCLVRVLPIAREAQYGLAAVLLATSPFRVLGQFSLLSYALALAGAQHRSPIVGGLLMGLGLCKPHVGGVLVMAHVMMRDWVRVAVAVSVPVVLMGPACLVLGVGPSQLLTDVFAVLGDVHGGSGVTTGHTELEPWLVAWLPTVATLAGSIVLGLVLLAPVAAGAVRVGTPWTDTRRWECYALCGLVSLLATRHLSYDLVVVLPLLVAWWPVPRRLWLLTAVWLVVQLPGWWRRVFEPMPWPDVFGVILEVDRAMCVALFGLLVWRFIRLDVTK